MPLPTAKTKMIMKTFNNDPNFSIVMPGGCNAACAFCFNRSKVGNMQNASKDKWLLGLERTLQELPKQFYQISITGNEPAISPYFDEMLRICSHHKYSKRFTNILLTTNGTNLLNNIEHVSAGVHHINVSRHHYDEKQNKAIFGGAYNVTDDELERIIDEYSSLGIDVSLNCVIDNSTTVDFVMEYIKFAKRVGAHAVRFRKQNGNDLGMTPCEYEINKYYPILTRGECPVCRTWTRVIKGMETFWKASVIEPTDVVKDVVYELIYDTDGNVYLDWDKKRKYDVHADFDRRMKEIMRKNIIEHRGCMSESAFRELMRDYSGHSRSYPKCGYPPKRSC